MSDSRFSQYLHERFQRIIHEQSRAVIYNSSASGEGELLISALVEGGFNQIDMDAFFQQVAYNVESIDFLVSKNIHLKCFSFDLRDVDTDTAESWSFILMTEKSGENYIRIVFSGHKK